MTGGVFCGARLTRDRTKENHCCFLNVGYEGVVGKGGYSQTRTRTFSKSIFTFI